MTEQDSSTNPKTTIVNGAPLNKLVVFIIVSLSLLMVTIDTTIVATALDTLQKDLDVSVNWAGWTITAYSFGFVLMLPLSAKLSIKYGPRNLYLTSVSVFTIASLFCGLTNSIEMLIVWRVVQAMGAAGITPSVTAIIVNHFGSARDRAVSLFGSIFPIGVMIGPIFGGLFVTYWSWPWIFFVNVPFGLAVVLLSLKFIPKDRVDKMIAKTKMDFMGMLWLGVGILACMVAATYLGDEESQVFSRFFITMAIVAGIGLTGFFIHINRKKNPFIAPRFVSGKGFSAVNLLNILFSGGTSGILSLVPLFAASRYGINEMDAATLLIAQGVASLILSTLITIILRSTGYRLPLWIGGGLAILGTLILVFKPMWGVSPYFWLMGATFLMGCGVGTMSPPARNAGLQLAPESSATIAALRSMCLQLGSIIFIAIATAIIAGGENPGEIHAQVYLGMSLFFTVGLLLIRFVPEHKGAW